MRLSCLLFTGLLCGFLTTVIGSYDGGYASIHDLEPSYHASPIVNPPHHHHGHSAGSYYHYHVPVVGQQHYQPSHHHHDESYLWPLLLLLALPLLFLPLLPLLLLPLGISLLALLAPGGMMMMMMMMMMMEGEMMRRTDHTHTVSGRAFGEMRAFSQVVLVDMTSLLSKYARSLDLDQCPQRIACEMGATIFPENNTTETASSAKAFSGFLMEKYLPKGKVRKMVKHYEKAFWTGSRSLNSCKAFNCQPTFKIKDFHQNRSTFEAKSGTHNKFVNYIYPHSSSKVNAKKVYHNTTYLSDVGSLR